MLLQSSGMIAWQVVSILLFTSGIQAAGPRLAFPINSQVPPVAFVAEPYDFVFAANTFADDDQTTYSLSDNPDWLSIDGPNRRLHGTPNDRDVGAANFQITATNSQGRAVSDITLVVAEDRTITIRADILTELAKAGKTSTPAALLLRPFDTFSFAVSKDTFNGTSENTKFYAVSSDGAPLPPWVHFDSSALTFSGVAPPLTSTLPSRQSYSFSLSASDVVGFSEATVQFQIIVETSILAFSPPRQTFNITGGDEVHVPSLLRQLTLDGNTIQRQSIKSVSTSAPNWLTLNGLDFSFSGIAPQDVESMAFAISVTTLEEVVANASILFQTTSSSATVEQINLGIENATINSYFSYTFQRLTGFDNDSINDSSVEFELGQTASWLRFEPSNLTVYGIPAQSQDPGSYNITVRFTSVTRVIICSLVIDIVTGSTSESQPTMTVTSLSVPSNTAIIGTDTRNDDNAWSTKDKINLGLKIGLPLLAVLILVAVILCLQKRRLRKCWHRGRTRVKEEIPGIVPGDPEEMPTHVDTPSGNVDLDTYEKCVDNAPHIDLTWAPDSLQRTRTQLARKHDLRRKSALATSWTDLLSPSLLSADDVVTPLPTQPAFRQSEIPNTRIRSLRANARRRSSRQSVNARASLQSHPYRVSKSSVATSYNSMALPKRMSGAGHGAGLNFPLHGDNLRSSWYTTFGSIPLTQSRPQTVRLSAFPAPPVRQEVSRSSTVEPLNSRSPPGPTVRLVSGINGDADTFEIARQKYYAERARDQLEGTARFTNNASTPRGKSAGFPTSGPLDKRSVFRSKGTGRPTTTQRSSSSAWSLGSAVVARSTMDSEVSPMRRNISVASSGQFDSAISSESQWEDEALIADEDDAGERNWQTHDRPPPRLLYKSYGLGAEVGSGSSQSPSREPQGWASVHRPRVVDHRRKVSIGAMATSQPEQSQYGSLRFV